ncbi:DNA-directed DNA polymerase [Synchytrium endobioticum]|uniref:DNA-directed DNA polymerase n=1 Tax=Synchytrium endobioticum TaxID=286115 RepID=A0A507D174_9FUNG|nr:DNA-directed DNA polymerase [Synchytrium endobioticum]
MSNNSGATSSGVKLDFVPLTDDGRNYQLWAATCSGHLAKENLRGWITTNTEATADTLVSQSKAWFTIWNHISDTQRYQNMAITDPFTLWNNIKDVYNAASLARKPTIMKEWDELKFASHKTVADYNTAVNKLKADMTLVGMKDQVTDAMLIEKAINTLPTSSFTLAMMLRQQSFTKHTDLIKSLLDHEANNNAFQHDVFGNALTTSTNTSIHPTAPLEVYGIDHKRGTRYHRHSGNRAQRFRPRFKPYRPHQSNYHPSNTAHGTSDVVCFNCDGKGHLSTICPSPKIQTAAQGISKRGSNKRAPRLQFHNTNTYVGNVDHDSDESEQPVKNDNESDTDPPGHISFMTLENDIRLRTALIDTGSKISIFHDKSIFEDITYYTNGGKPVSTVNGTAKSLVGYGKVTISLQNEIDISIAKAYYAPKSPRHIISRRDLRSIGLNMFTNDNAMYLYNRNNTVVLTIPEDNDGFHTVEVQALKDTEENMFMDDRRTKDYLQWHSRLGHLSNESIRRLVSRNVVIKSPLQPHELPSMNDHIAHCKTCKVAKLIEQPYSLSVDKGYQMLERVDVDIQGPLSPPSDGNSYVLITVDYRSRLGMIDLLPSRSQAFAAILACIYKMQAHHPNLQPRVIRIDNALEFRSNRFNEYCIANGIRVEYSPPYVSQLNGIAEAYNKKIQHVGRSLLFGSRLPVTCWGLAFHHAAYLLA